jgi:hypothetical protein
MTKKKTDNAELSQLDHFQEVARALGCDEDEAAFDAKLKDIAQHKPAPAHEPKKK